MISLLFVLATAAFAEEPDLSAVRNLEEKLPDYNKISMPKEDTVKRQQGDNKFMPTIRITDWERIKESGSELGSVAKDIILVRVEDNETLITDKPVYLRYFKLEDEYGFKYLINNDGTTTYKIDSRYVRPLKGELALYETPLKYTPAPANKIERTYDKKLRITPEASLYLGYVAGDYMKDLFNDSKAHTGLSNQVGLHLITAWDMPLKIGAAVHYEQTAYNLTGGGKANYKSLSAGPLIRTKEREFLNLNLRLEAQLRVSPWAQVSANTSSGTTSFDFNSTDLFVSVEHPMKNKWGEFVLGSFLQTQWLNLKDQKEIVSLRASNRTNKIIGLSISQVFE